MVPSRSSLALVTNLFRSYPGRSLIMVGALLLSGLSEGIGLMAFFPLLTLATGDSSASTSALNRCVSHAFAWFGCKPSIEGILIVIVVGMGVKGAFALVTSREVGYAVAHVMTELRLRLLRALLQARWRYFVDQPIGALVNAMSSEIVRASWVYSSITEAIALFIQVVICSVLIFLTSWKVAVFGLVFGGGFILLFGNLIRSTKKAGSKQTELLNSLSSLFTDVLQGIKPVKAMGAEKALLTMMENQTLGLNQAQQSQIWNAGLLVNLQEPALALIMGLGLYFGLVFFHLSFAEIMVPAFLFYRLLNRIHSMQKMFQSVALNESAFISIGNRIERAEEECEVVDPDSTGFFNYQEIAFDRVAFSYGEKRVLEPLSFRIGKGDFVAIIGPSGAGKTTLVDLLVRLSDPDSGEIRIDDRPLRDISLSDWRRQIGYVPQEMLLFHASIYQNLTLEDPNITREEAVTALQMAEAWDFVTKMPEGMETIVGERGAKLSGGQRQRISLARALCRKPTLLILDEVSASLDPQAEQAICKTLKSLSQTVTILAISHQPAITQAADRTYCLADGKLTEMAIPVASSMN